MYDFSLAGQLQEFGVEFVEGLAGLYIELLKIGLSSKHPVRVLKDGLQVVE